MIKPDVWIEKMVIEHNMIEPFEDSLKKEGVISYGLSSYGYDIRLAPEFKIFTNINSIVVDPKQFDEGIFVDFIGDICIIPPNSFALGRSVEYIRMPRNVTGIVLGKSTYARCFSGDTKIALVDGTSPTIEDMAIRYKKGEIFWGYSVNSAGEIICAKLEQPRYIGEDVLVEILLDNNKAINCTPDHKFLMRDGSLVAACDLREGSSIMPLYRKTHRGYEAVYQPKLGRLNTTYRLADAWNIRNNIYPNTPNTHRHHINYNKANNNPSNIIRMDASEHISHHNKIYYDKSIFDAEKHGYSVKSISNKRGTHPVYCLTVPEAGNFALDAGVFVENCGIVTNFTPLEAGWEGHITIEISNTTTLPAKIYANEGIAQILFLESDEPCRVSYADRKGKYQGQTDITLPKL